MDCLNITSVISTLAALTTKNNFPNNRFSDMEYPHYAPLLDVLRGPIVESVIYGAIAVCNSAGTLVYQYGDPDVVTYLRSTAKPFQALPFVELGGVEVFGLSDEELALLCASHSGTDRHLAVLHSIQEKVGVSESDLMCGAHPAYDEETAQAMFLNGDPPTPNRHNCSGKHTGMLAQATLRHLSKANYIAVDHPVQKLILQTCAEMTHLPLEQLILGTDGCSAPVFAVPLRNAAWAMALLADPLGMSARRAAALRHIFRAMTTYPFMVAGPNRFDTLVMEVAGGKILAKAGAEGYQGMSIQADSLYPGSPALGITMKISDGDQGGRARSIVATEVLRQLGALNSDQLAKMAAFDARPQYNWRNVEVGSFRPAFKLEKVG
jgi:L-asparaginase II